MIRSDACSDTRSSMIITMTPAISPAVLFINLEKAAIFSASPAGMKEFDFVTAKMITTIKLS